MKKINISLNGKQDSVERAIKQLEKYKKELLQDKGKKFCTELIKRGIRVAQINGGEYKPYLSFTAELKDSNDKVITYEFVARKTQDLSVSWKVKDGTRTVEVDPLLMAEFGSGWLAYDVWGLNGVGQGTFPNQKHALDPNGWRWVDEKGTHHSIGQQPSLPVYKAWVEMSNSISEVAKEVFR